MSVKDCNGVRKTLKRLNVQDAERTLGVRLAPGGNCRAEFKYLLQQRAKAWADAIQVGHLPRDLVWKSMTSTILRTLYYPLAATTFTKEQCKAIMAPLLKVGLPQSGSTETYRGPWFMARYDTKVWVWCLCGHSKGWNISGAWLSTGRLDRIYQVFCYVSQWS